MTKILGPLPCKSCGCSVWIDRMGRDVRVMEGKSVHVHKSLVNRFAARSDAAKIGA